MADFLSEIMKARREWNNISKVLKGNLSAPNSISSKKKSFNNEGKIRTFSDKRKLREFDTSRPTFTKKC